MDLTISIVSWNTRDLLDACLRSVRETTRAIDYEVIVVDNASTDGSAEMVTEKYPEVKLIRNSENVGFARANNQALRESAGNYFLLLNSDTVIHDDAFAEMIKFMNAHPECGACGPMLVNPDGSLQPSWAKLPNVYTEAVGTHDRRIGRFDPSQLTVHQLSRTEPFEVGWVGGACLMARRQAIKEVGPMDEGYFMYCEETDWCWRFHAAGYKVFYVPQARVTHLGGASSKNTPVRTVLRSEYSRLRLLWRTGLANRLLCVPFLLIVVLRVVGRAVLCRAQRREKDVDEAV